MRKTPRRTPKKTPRKIPRRISQRILRMIWLRSELSSPKRAILSRSLRTLETESGELKTKEDGHKDGVTA